MKTEANKWAAILHISQLSYFFFPLAGLIVPVVIWQMKKREFPSLDTHGRMVMNWAISITIYSFLALGLTAYYWFNSEPSGFFSMVAITGAVFGILSLIGMIWPILGAIKAADGIVWRYPLAIPIL